MHEFWLHHPDREFDVCLVYWGDREGPDPSTVERLVRRKGTKFPNLAHCYLADPDWFRQYSAIWTVDDDIIMPTHAINTMFRIFMEEKMSLAQPAFDHDSFCSQGVLFQRPGGPPVRLTNFVENNVSIFSQAAFQLCLPTFFHPNALTGWGIDVVWSKLLGHHICNEPEGPRPHRIGIIDAVSCHHPPRTDLNPSVLDQVIPRHYHETQGLELMRQFGINCDDSPLGIRNLP